MTIITGLRRLCLDHHSKSPYLSLIEIICQEMRAGYFVWEYVACPPMLVVWRRLVPLFLPKSMCLHSNIMLSISARANLTSIHLPILWQRSCGRYNLVSIINMHPDLALLLCAKLLPIMQLASISFQLILPVA